MHVNVSEYYLRQIHLWPILPAQIEATELMCALTEILTFNGLNIFSKNQLFAFDQSLFNGRLRIK